MNITFNTKIAQSYGGMEAAVLIQNFFYWITHNKKKKKNLKDGQFWTYSSVNDLQQKYSFISLAKIRNTLTRLVKQGVLVKGNYNRHKYDRTTWWTFKNEIVLKEISHLLNRQIDYTEQANPDEQINEPIPKLLKQINKQVEVEEGATKTTDKPVNTTPNKIDVKLYEQLIQRKLSPSQITDIIKVKESVYILDKIKQYDYLNRTNPKKMRNKARYLYCSLKDDWTDNTYIDRLNQKKREIKKNAEKQEVKLQEKEKQEHVDQVEKEAQDYYNNLPKKKQKKIRNDIVLELNKSPFYKDNPNIISMVIESRIISYVVDKYSLQCTIRNSNYGM